MKMNLFSFKGEPIIKKTQDGLTIDRGNGIKKTVSINGEAGSPTEADSHDELYYFPHDKLAKLDSEKRDSQKSSSRLPKRVSKFVPDNSNSGQNLDVNA